MLKPFIRPKISNNSFIRDEKSNKHIANGYKKLVHTFKHEAVQFFVAKNLAVNHLPLEALPEKRDAKGLYFVFGGACVTNLVVFFLCYRSSNSLRLVDVQTCSKFGRKQTHLFRPTISTSTSCLEVSSAVSILCFSESLNLNYENTLFTT